MITRRQALALTLGATGSLVALPAMALYTVDYFGKQPVTLAVARLRAWPESLLPVMNHPLREEGWHPFFSECPNDAYHFGYRLRSAEDASQLLAAWSATGDPGKQVMLLADPPFLPERGRRAGYQGHLQLGSQPILDEWWQRLPNGKFGVHHYPAPPRAVPPMLTLYLGGTGIKVGEIKVPMGMKVLRPERPMPGGLGPSAPRE